MRKKLSISLVVLFFVIIFVLLIECISNIINYSKWEINSGITVEMYPYLEEEFSFNFSEDIAVVSAFSQGKDRYGIILEILQNENEIIDILKKTVDISSINFENFSNINFSYEITIPPNDIVKSYYLYFDSFKNIFIYKENEGLYLLLEKNSLSKKTKFFEILAVD